MSHKIKALAVHGDSYFAQRKMAESFAETEGHIANIGEILNARVHSPISDYIWENEICTSTVAYIGHNKIQETVVVVAHGNGPQPRALYEFFPQREKYDDGRTLVISAEDFDGLLDGQYGDVEILTYKEKGVTSNKESPLGDDGLREIDVDPILMAIVRGSEAYKERFQGECSKWLSAGGGGSSAHGAPFTNVTKIGQEAEKYEKNHLAHDERVTRKAHVIKLGAPYFRSRDKIRTCSSSSINALTTLEGVRDKPLYDTVGVRKCPAFKRIAPSVSKVADQIREKWQFFSQKESDVVTDAYVGIKPGGKTKKPYYIIDGADDKPICTARIQEDGRRSVIPEYRVRKSAPIAVEGLRGDFRSYSDYHKDYPGAKLWRRAVIDLPRDANAIQVSETKSNHGLIPKYYQITIDKESFGLLMKVGDEFFTQYSDSTNLLGEPHRHVKSASVIESKRVINIPKGIADYALDWCREDWHKWRVYYYLLKRAPNKANALYIERKYENTEKKVMRITVSYYAVTYSDKVIRPFAEIAQDFDWYLEKCHDAGIV